MSNRNSSGEGFGPADLDSSGPDPVEGAGADRVTTTSGTPSATPAAGTVLVVLHQARSTPGRIGERLERRGYALDVRRPALGDALPERLDGHDGVVVFGGPMSANDPTPFITEEIRLLERALASATPSLGVCLGAQLMAKALGARVAPHEKGACEIGYYPLEATTAGAALMPWPSHVYHWHSEGFDLPAGADLLATGSAFPNQAFRYGGTAYGLQFHPEVTREMMCAWTERGAHRLTSPGAQPREAHFDGWGRYDGAVCRWLDAFLDAFLGPCRGSGIGPGGQTEPKSA
ncbi:glutamine amidotransferase [Xanthobacter versatilis]|uniref:glutamine amidotransferase n=1 Tax=Xanthobacter autotrophicus (strain ATCC BAA-1158 / Py2) TaxID=78245 RepID=UPI00372BCB22